MNQRVAVRNARFGLIVGSALLVGAVAGSAQQRNFNDLFTGTIAVQNSDEMRSSRIRFEAGARTNWHVHSTGQLLLIEEGRGRWQEEGGTVMPIEAGHPVYTTPNVPHWHGASPEEAAVQFSVYSGTLEWRDAVTDAQYEGR